ncbi:hypothetical protein [Chromobacterium violaceum]|uniref:hypothetical protein n=1 Tax=Chromobacterium violaceum TaxID=536 RepID=UPI001CE07535|nr:hypothetical protein [Chromobacterium violaceum]
MNLQHLELIPDTGAAIAAVNAAHAAGIMMNRSSYCSCCGALRGLSAQNQSYSLHDIVRVAEHRQIQHGDGRLVEASPQLLVHVGVFRNGGGAATDEHICNACLLLGIRHALSRLNALIPEAEA